MTQTFEPITEQEALYTHPVDLMDAADYIYEAYQRAKSRQERTDLRTQYNMLAAIVNQKIGRKMLTHL